jgi:hypothetical protein
MAQMFRFSRGRDGGGGVLDATLTLSRSGCAEAARFGHCSSEGHVEEVNEHIAQ